MRELVLRRRRSRLPWVYLVYRERVGRVVPRPELALGRGPAIDPQFCRRRNAGTSSGESTSIV